MMLMITLGHLLAFQASLWHPSQTPMTLHHKSWPDPCQDLNPRHSQLSDTERGRHSTSELCDSAQNLVSEPETWLSLSDAVPALCLCNDDLALVSAVSQQGRLITNTTLPNWEHSTTLTSKGHPFQLPTPPRHQQHWIQSYPTGRQTCLEYIT